MIKILLKNNWSFKFKNKNVIEIGSGKGALTEYILKKKPKTFQIIEKDFNLAKKFE